MSAAGSQGSPRQGIPFALSSAVLIGLAPIFGKQAIGGGLPPLAVVAARTAGASLLVFIAILLFRRRLLYIFPLGLVGCFLAGGLNGAGSLLYYSALARVDAGLGQLLFSLHPIFVAMLVYLDGQRHSRLTIAGLLLSLPAVYLLTGPDSIRVDLRGAAMMLGAGLLYALHLPINQRVLYEAPAPTVTLYTLLAMSSVVIPAFLMFSPPVHDVPQAALRPVLALTAVTFLSRLALFAGVKSIGGMQASLLGLAELLVAVSLAQLWLGESLEPSQWAGAILMVVALVLAGRDRAQNAPNPGKGWLYWLRPPLAASLPSGAEGSELPGENPSGLPR